MTQSEPLVKIRARFVGSPNEEKKKKGYYNNIFYDIVIKQDGVKFLVKRADERVKGESRIDYNNLHEFTEDWTLHVKYIIT